jgi:hypothetical protein
MFLGYSVNHAHEVYRMLNMETKYVINLRDIIWLNQVYNDWKVKKGKKYVEDDNAIEPKINVINKVQVEKVLDEQKRANPEASRIVKRIKQGREILLDHSNLAFLGGGVVEQKEPTTFDEAWNHNDPRTRESGKRTSTKNLKK